MLTVHYSNRLESLADELVALTRQPLASPFAGEVVVVQSRGVARWLSLELADRAGVCANVRFPFPTAFAWELFRALGENVPEQSAFEPEILAWRILRLLPEAEKEGLFAPVRVYTDGDELKRFELATRLAQLYDEYLVYRPDWMLRWEREEPQTWQAALWRRLAQEGDARHYAALQAQVVTTLAGRPPRAVALPERISIFGAPALPPSLLALFKALGRHADVHLFFQNPCREYWGDIEDEPSIARNRAARKVQAQYSESGNRLLASLGKQGRDFLDLATEIEGALERDHFVEPAAATLLASIQSDILHLTEPAPGEDAPLLRPDDRSLQIHSCHSAMREVEVLHDQLLALFEAGDLEPAQVVVMTPDIATYAPYIEAVFGTARPAIPFNVSDRSAEQASTLAGTFMALLELPGSRYDAHRVMGILDEASVQQRFGLTEGDLETVRRWVRESGIRWGIDGAHRARFGLPATHEHTWRFGLDRLIVGYALPGAGERLFGGILPYDEVEGSLGAALGRFQSFAEAAIALDSGIKGARPIRAWCAALHEILAAFFEPSEARAEELEAVRACIAALERDARIARYDGAVSLAVLTVALRARLEPPGRAFLSGGVTFCATVPMRSLPFEVVCMIGMNDGAFPRVRSRDGFDLMAEDFRKGDRSRRDDDRYLFLESLLSARRCLYMSFVGRHIRDDSVMPPSVLVSELVDYVERAYRTEEGGKVRESILTLHPLQAFSRRYFEGGKRLFSHSKTLARAASVAGRGERTPRPFITGMLGVPEEESRSVDVEMLVRFFRNPARQLFERRLKVRLESADDELEAREPFAFDGLALYDLKERLLDLELRGAAPDGLELARAGGVLPYGRVGEVLFAEQSEVVAKLAQTVAPLLPAKLLEPVAFEMKAGPLTFRGALTRVSSQGLLDYRPVKCSANVRVRTWIRHLVLSAFAPKDVERVTRCVAQDCTLVFGPVDDARKRLRELLDLYWQGMQRPLHFFPRTACAYVEHGEIDKAVLTVWRGGYDGRPPGERDDPYYALAFRDSDPLDEAFEAAARTVFAPLTASVNEEERI